LFTVLALSLALAVPLQAQAKKKTKPDRLEGRVQMINKATSTITLRVGEAPRVVVYDSNTKFDYRNKPSSVDEVKDGRRLICVGKFDDKARLMATQISVRSGK
jgi:hypothetical protein